MGGAGAVTAGGLYWKRGTTPAAWASMITGSTLAVSGVIIQSIKGEDFFLTGMEMFGISMAVSVVVYVLVSLLGPKNVFNMNKMLHRGNYRIDEPGLRGISVKGAKGFITSEFTRGDKFIYGLIITWTLGWFGVFVIGTIYNFRSELSVDTWAVFWRIYVYVSVITVAVTIVWYLIGGILDIKRMFRSLASVEKNDEDDGMVRDNQNLCDLPDKDEKI